ncbi:MAG: dihydroxyacetone kinase subunit L [Bacteroidales bacterium]|nr:dihydroxyacetone kinase subunit L [Bacteroidales bacterium]
MQKFDLDSGAKIVDNLILVIQENKQYLSDIDGAIGDGDHGINMNKGFTMCREELDKNPGDLGHGLKVLSKILMMKIGGSMGPLYGKFFKAIAKTIDGKSEIDKHIFAEILMNIQSDIAAISPAKVGDKTLIDTLVPATKAFKKAVDEDKSFEESLNLMKVSAQEGRDSTKDLVAKLGRASRLGERSRGVIDAGSASCCLILETMADTINEII